MLNTLKDFYKYNFSRVEADKAYDRWNLYWSLCLHNHQYEHILAYAEHELDKF